LVVEDNLDQKRQLEYSVKKDDSGGGYVQFIIPYYSHGALPPELPDYNDLYGYNTGRDRLLLSAPRHEGQWANAIGIAIAKMASLNWALEGNRPMVIKWTQSWLLNAGAGMGIFGWVPFLSMHLGAYLALGRAFIEIERASPANGSKVINIHHLNPLRCRLTGDPQYPVNYQGGDGVRRLSWHQVIPIIDMPDPTEGELGISMGAAERAYKKIALMAAIESYVYEKVSGRRPQAIYFLGGATSKSIRDAIQGSQLDADRRGVSSFMGATIQPVLGDVPLNLVTIPLAELPDGFDATQERERADLNYANAIGLDPQDLNPALVGRQGLGSTGNQSVVLARKQRGRGLSAWMAQFGHALNELALSANVLFTFSDPSPEEQETEAGIQKTRAETRQTQIESGEITPEQARNLAVDQGDLPREFLEHDETGGDVVRDDDKLLAESMPPDELEAAAAGPEAPGEATGTGSRSPEMETLLADIGQFLARKAETN